MAASRNCRNFDLTASLGAFLATRAAAGRLCVALSGGRDSTALLHAAASLGLAERLMAIHVHHGISPHADHWALHCQQLCAARAVPLQVVRVDVVRDSGLGLEAAARQARYAAFVASAADFVLLAHHRDDQAETVLYNLLRGSGVTGAAAMPIERQLRDGPRLLRPWLAVSAVQIAAYAEAEQLVWVEDESNADAGFSRNFLRHQVLPTIGARFPGAAACLANAAQHFSEADGLLAEFATTDWEACAVGEALAVQQLRLLKPARVKNLLRWRLRHLGWRVPATERLDEFVRQVLEAGPEGRPRLDLPDGSMSVMRRLLRWQAALE